MGMVLRFRTEDRAAQRRRRGERKAACEIVIFPGVRMERHLDLGHRVRDAAGRGDFDGLGGKNRPRKTS